MCGIKSSLIRVRDVGNVPLVIGNNLYSKDVELIDCNIELYDSERKTIMVFGYVFVKVSGGVILTLNTFAI